MNKRMNDSPDTVYDEIKIVCENYIKHKTVPVETMEMGEIKEDKLEEMLRLFLSRDKKIENINSLSGEILVDEYKDILKKSENWLKNMKTIPDKRRIH